jgi:hypothetical protein
VGVEMSRGEIRENWANEIDNYLSSL